MYVPLCGGSGRQKNVLAIRTIAVLALLFPLLSVTDANIGCIAIA